MLKPVREGLKAGIERFTDDILRNYSEDLGNAHSFLNRVSSFIPKEYSGTIFTSEMEEILDKAIQPYLDVRSATNSGVPKHPRLQTHAERVSILIILHAAAQKQKL